jgi:valyl-tRNA synthetase
MPIQVDQLPKHFDSKEAEQRWSRKWEEWGIYRYDPGSEKPVYSIDTPPPTVSGSLHIGHVFSYTHTDLIARYERMRGKNIFYPMGWDDNGLPTERRVQNYYNVRCDAHLPYIKDLKVEPADTRDKHAPPSQKISRLNFIELCLKLTAEDEKAFRELWQRLGLSVDWSQEYATIDARCRRAAQLSFLDLYKKGHVYSTTAPTMWDVDFQTAVAQAEIEDRPQRGNLHRVRFGVEGGQESFVIATTRPELLPACVAVTAHPEDARYKHLFGKRAITPLFRVPVPIFPSDMADPTKGTGILMVCTFGDAADVAWWREQGLPLRQIIGRNGHLAQVSYGTPGWESNHPETANQFYSQLAGKTVRQAKKIAVELLRDPAGAAAGNEAPLVGEPEPVEQAVKFFEKGEQPLEFISTRQWFVRLLDKKAMLLDFGERIHWHPDFMRVRYSTWTENLQFDWAISRQRYFGVSFPLWYPLTAQGEPDLEHPLLADPATLPIDPMTTAPPGYDESRRDQPGGFTAEADVFDTWFTSSLTPQIATQWMTDEKVHRKLFPMDLRPQAHEIIRTWAFYTIAKSALHQNSIPWRHVAISGWVLDPDRKKMSKSKGNVVTPMNILEQYGSDAVRYWSANARLGTDTALDENIFKIGKRLVTKIFNAGKFVIQQTGEPGSISSPLDLAFLSELKAVVERATAAAERYDHAGALTETEQFFWAGFADNYLEMVKGRARSESDAAGRASALATLSLTLRVFLRLFAPFLPYITEEVWSWIFADEAMNRSVHTASWPSVSEFPSGDQVDDVFDTAVACLTAIKRAKSESHVAIGREVTQLQLICNPARREKLERVFADVLSGGRVLQANLSESNEVRDSFEIAHIEFAQPAGESGN